MADPRVVDVADLSFRYGDGSFSLHVPEFQLAAAETVACIGPSGCGKTTFLNLIAGILTAECGRVLTLGREWSVLGEAERRRARIAQIGMVFQSFELLDYLTVRENVLLPYHVHGALRLTGEVERRAETLAQATGVASLLRRHPRDLSQGERQRIAICRALVTHPPLLLADEPTGNLDPLSTRSILDLLLEQAAQRGTSVVVVTHDHGLLASFDRVVDFASDFAPEVVPR